MNFYLSQSYVTRLGDLSHSGRQPFDQMLDKAVVGFPLLLLSQPQEEVKYEKNASAAKTKQ